ncbi:lipopolysaccharide biosynthesis protein RfbH [Aminithiophilus ramosus]|uniref:Lipopolysaccharide biosynthesis protein RfbH n=1 Tax=Aminithiophilus ramosus TaxID=3029084 RepID=A0A9Q7AFY9_9BACT|nr:lipopolysaccharide biosynthesis protein RfbH [Aminithiophilus ramosus]QTX33434.1 lipopolysaccharide biosynthesis protein RfbH [Aminithiophilus ramosus]
MSRKEELKAQILDLVGAYYDEVHRPKPRREGERVAYGGRVFDGEEMKALAEACLDFWLTSGPWSATFEADFARYLGVERCAFVNSGSSANLLAFMALTSPTLGDRAIGRGDEVITVAAAFPTTVAPLVQFGAVPVFVDVTLPTYNVDAGALDEALSDRTKAVFLAHTLGNPFDVEAVRTFCDRHGLWLIEDNCDALGSRVLFRGAWRLTGSLGHLATSSFYPPHHMTTGEGGAVCDSDEALHRVVLSLRDWGRDCRCPSGTDDLCGCRFSGQFGTLPRGYDHKYVYSHFGYNLKATDLQAAIGVAQLRKVPAFVEARRRNWKILREALKPWEDFFILPEATEGTDPSWFGFLLTVRPEAPFSRDGAVAHLEAKGIQTRMLFAGNLLRHPCFDAMRASGQGYRVVGDLATTDRIMKDTFWIGVYPGLDGTRMTSIVEALESLCVSA